MANGEGIESAVELEQRLTRIEVKIDAAAARQEQYIKDHQAFAEREIKRNDEDIAALTAATQTACEWAVEGRVRWQNHYQEHKEMGRKERTWDAIVGAFAALAAAAGHQFT